MVSKRYKKLRYFYYKGELHKTMFISRADDLISAWNYNQHKMFKYVYSEIKRKAGRAYSTEEVCNILNRNRITFYRAWEDGCVERPQQIYPIELGESIMTSKFMWSEDDIYKMHEELLSRHTGRPRLDGQKVPHPKTPTRAELRAMLKNDTIFYVKTEGGEFVPTWKAI